MQIKEFEGFTLKECLQQVRNDMGPDAVILETRKFRKGGVMGLGARDAVCIVAAIGITVHNDLPMGRSEPKVQRPAETIESSSHRVSARSNDTQMAEPKITPSRPTAASVAARSVYGRNGNAPEERRGAAGNVAVADPEPDAYGALLDPVAYRGTTKPVQEELLATLANARSQSQKSADSLAPAQKAPARSRASSAPQSDGADTERFSYLEKAMGEIRECLLTLQREQRESHDRTVSAVVSAVAPAVTAVSAAGLAQYADEFQPRFPDLYARLLDSGVSETILQAMFDELPDMSAWSEAAQEPLAISALRDLIARRISSRGPIQLTPGQLKAVALVGPTGVGKTTTIAKLAAHFALMQNKKVALLTVDTYRIAAVEQLKVYSQIIDIPVAVAYSHAEVLPVIERFADYDLILIDTAGRSQKNIMQIGELKSLLETVNCETHLVLSAPIKEKDMVESAQRFSAARVDRLIFTKLDETSSYGTLLNVADRTGIPLSYVTTGQKVPEDLEVAEGCKLANLILD